MFDKWSFDQIGSVPAWGSLILLLIWTVRTWPHWKAKVNEARKIQLDADGDRLAQAFARIRVLEDAQTADRKDFSRELSEAIREERKRCDKELDEIRMEMRSRLTAAEEENKGLKSSIRQNSQSGARMIHRPDAAAESLTKQKDTE